MERNSASNRANTRETRGSGTAGLTVLELLVVMTLLGVAAAFATPAIGTGLDNMTLRSTGRRLVSVFRQAQVQARTRQQPIALRIGTGRIVFAGEGTPASNLSLDESVVLNGGGESTYLFFGSGLIVGPQRLQIENRRGRQAALILGPAPGSVRFVEQGELE